ncbi:hypothetical protein J6590_037336 [Homalodisca vitripennis]|nr:hypothetical protein J6590_037336 [Homalodisca vitripennis]
MERDLVQYSRPAPWSAIYGRRHILLGNLLPLFCPQHLTDEATLLILEKKHKRSWSTPVLSRQFPGHQEGKCDPGDLQMWYSPGHVEESTAVRQERTSFTF